MKKDFKKNMTANKKKNQKKPRRNEKSIANMTGNQEEMKLGQIKRYRVGKSCN